MTNDRDIERILDAWLGDGPSELPDRVFDIVADRIERQPQRSAWRPQGRIFDMNTTLRWAAAIAAVAVIAIAGYNFLPGSSVGGLTPTPSLQPAPTATFVPTASPTGSDVSTECDLGTTGCAGPLAVGDHRSAEFDPLVTYATEGGLWSNTVDTAAAYVIDSPDGALLLWSHPAIVERTAACETTPTSGRGNAPNDWIDYITAHPGLVATNVKNVVIGGPLLSGGRVGRSVDLTASTDWTPACADDLWTANLVQFIVSSVPSPIGIYGVSSGGTARFVFLDVSGQTVLVAYYPKTGVGTFPAAQRIIDSMRFGCGPAVGRPCGVETTSTPTSTP